MAIPEFEDDDIQNAVDFLSDIFLSILRLYKSKQDLTSNESVFSHLLVYRFMDSVAISIQNNHDCGSDFIPREVYLSVVKKRLRDIGSYKGDRFQYKADGIIKMINIRGLELLLVETSGPYGSIDKTKSNFDHHKWTFGTLAMLKTIADEFNYAEISVFANTKVFFVYATENSIYLWSLSFKKKGIYELWREESVDIKPLFTEHKDMLQDTILFFYHKDTS
ncbi:hypothetical protein CLU79DRAFT_885243 [Phycomyces nitens]|nr:hypothetical protein CLU79DRAFT_885243 [Phycomyces nitens]